jgi:hypothetical protein
VDARAQHPATIVGEYTMSDIEKQIEQWRAGLAESELLGGSDVNELESHLREEIEHLKTSGLADDEAVLVARRRLGDTAALEEEFAKVNPHRRLANRLYWMVMGVLSYFVVWPLSWHVSAISAYFAYVVGLRGAVLTSFAHITTIATMAVIGLLVLRYLAWHCHPRIMAKRISIPICVGALAACANLALTWTVNFTNHHLWRQVIPSIEAWRQATRATASRAWWVMMMFLFAGALAVFARRSREPVEVR